MLVQPRPYYVCDYCESRLSHSTSAKYLDNSGIDNKCYDICCDACLELHIMYLKTVKDKYEIDSISDWIKYHFWINGRTYNQDEKLFENVMSYCEKIWNEL